jgi:cytochrome c-type biogenesis protein CcmH
LNGCEKVKLRAIARRIVFLLLYMPLFTQSAPMNPATTARYHALLEELRCLVCQNESLAESNADLAEDLRTQIREMMARGASNKQVIHFLVARYGDFVLYRPPFKPNTYLLWLTPFLLGLAGLIALMYRIRLRARYKDVPLSSQEQRRLRELLNGDNRD